MIRTLLLTTIVFQAFSATLYAEESVDFATQIQPIFAESCIGCHGEEKALGKLRLHTPAGIQEKLADDEHLLVAGKPEESEIYERITLPEDHKKRMPKQGDPLPEDQIELVRLWIEQGAKFGEAPGETSAEEKPETEKPAELPALEVNPASEEATQKLIDAGALVTPLYADSPLLDVSFALSNPPAGDEELALLVDVAEQVVNLNLAGAEVSSDGWAPLAELKNLSRLHLENSSIEDASLAHLAGSSRLEYLNLYGTDITDEGLFHLEGLKRLRKIYLWKTGVSYDAALKLEEAIPGLEFNIGYDHPAVVRKRLNEEFGRVKEMADQAQEEVAAAEQKLNEARAAMESHNSRLAELLKQLEQLDAEPAEEQDDVAPEQPKDSTVAEETTAAVN